ncbi:hypothetical protein Kpho02_07480 [Kitasatospora phosalacinea]|uniref:Uncharacterized protein n=1 Tax=Kitasatospora phosalacinea TaxID=2065 RepID=A0A9W6UYF5_9ACTN|nr:hypothetical protein [Kitasatospora phosalacinea]GLW68449.1 hypothetical protein Kpho02_07480 [Kitasatospora phosalacinea]
MAGQVAADSQEFAELALGVDEELFAGVPGESAVEREARLDVASAVLAELEREEPELAAYARRLMAFAPVPLRASRRPVGARGMRGSAVAA